MKLDFVEMNDILLSLERDTMLDHTGFAKSIRALQKWTEQDRSDSIDERTYLPQWMYDDASKIAGCFHTIFSSNLVDLEIKVRRCKSLLDSLHQEGPTYILILLTLGKLTTLFDTVDAERLFQDALLCARNENLLAWELTALLRLSRYFVYISHYERAFPLAYEAHRLRLMHPELDDFEATVEFHLGLCLVQLRDHQKAVSHFERALELYRNQEQLYFVAYTLQSLASALLELNEESRAQISYEECARIFNELEEWQVAGHAYTNCGLSYMRVKKFDEAARMMDQARSLFESSTDLAARAGNCLHRAMLYSKAEYRDHNASKALGLYREAFLLAEKTANRHLISSIYNSRSLFYRQNQDWQQAFEDYEKSVKLEQDIFRTTVDDKMRSLEQSHQRKLAEQEKAITSALLQKVLPTVIVERMKHDEQIADYFESVTVFFADIANFTSLALELSPKDVILMLNNVFDLFDDAMQRYGCEKIKTIGDGYMAVAGAPAELSFHQERIVLAALSLQDQLRNYTVGHSLNNLRHPAAALPLEFRMGLHCGSLVAGLVGTKRFIYDVYGDTVNTAARMESHGMVHEVQLSAEVLTDLCNHAGVAPPVEDFNEVIELHISEPESAHLRFVPRGVIPIKGRGSMHTYFVQRLD